MYDVIVVGAGSAGAALAARLSSDPAPRVLLLEAGRDWRAGEAPRAVVSANPIPIIHDPALQAAWQWPRLQSRRTRLQQPKHYWRGKALGGSSVVNAQIAIRGVTDAFDSWAEAGCEGWSGHDVLPVFDAIEDDPAPGHRRGGPLPVYRAPEASWGPVDRALKDAALAAGYPWNGDLNAPTGEGVSCYPINSRDGQRISTNEAFLEPARKRENLIIRGDALVDRIVFEGRAATGVRVRFGTSPWETITAREIILSAGAVHSPAILLRSGIGEPAALRALGITVTHALPAVGQNFMDHPIIRASIDLRPEYAPTDPDQRHTNCCVTYSSGLGGGGRRDMIIIGFNHRKLGPENAPAPFGAVGAALYNAFSRGHVALASADPDIDPVVEENMLDDPRDRLRMRDAVGRLARLADHPALAGIAARITLSDTQLSLAEGTALPPDALDDLLLREVGDIQHAAGTCRMTAYEDPRGVVDPDLRVKGIAGLRVADASIMPTDCRANTHFTCVMIGEALGRRMLGGG